MQHNHSTLLFIIVSALFLNGCIVSSARRKARAARQVMAHVQTAAKAKDKKKATLEAAVAIALAGREVKETRPFADAFFFYRDGDTRKAAVAFCRGLVRNDISNPAIVFGAMTAITLVGERNQLQWERFLRLMWSETKHCARYYIPARS